MLANTARRGQVESATGHIQLLRFGSVMRTFNCYLKRKKKIFLTQNREKKKIMLQIKSLAPVWLASKYSCAFTKPHKRFYHTIVRNINLGALCSFPPSPPPSKL